MRRNYTCARLGPRIYLIDEVGAGLYTLAELPGAPPLLFSLFGSTRTGASANGF